MNNMDAPTDSFMHFICLTWNIWKFLSFYLFSVATSPSLAINTVEFPHENVLPVGYNVTIVCTSNASRDNYGVPYYGQPYWIQFYFKDEERSIKECGGRDGTVDSEDSKVCMYSILNAVKNDSTNYSCWSHNQITCTEGKISLEFKGMLQLLLP